MYLQVADIPTDHPSCSKQHAVLQYRLVEVEYEDGTMHRVVKYSKSCAKRLTPPGRIFLI